MPPIQVWRVLTWIFAMNVHHKLCNILWFWLERSWEFSVDFSVLTHSKMFCPTCHLGFARSLFTKYDLILDVKGQTHQLRDIFWLNYNLLILTQDKYSQNVVNEGS